MNKIQKLYIPLLALGFSTSVIQVIMLREFVSVFYSNEIIFGLTIAFWMTLTGLGAWEGNKQKQTTLPEKQLSFMFLLLGLAPLLLVFLINYSKHIFFQPGVLINIYQILPIIAIALAPICLISGNIFNIISKSYLPQQDAKIGGKYYSVESTGSIIGGIVVSLVMVLYLNVMQSLAIVFAINLCTVLFCFSFGNKLLKLSLLVACIIFLSLFFIFDFDLKVRQFLYPNQKILESHETPYGNLTITENGDQKNFYENLSLLFTTENVINTEETAHYPLLQIKKPSKVLLIGGGLSGVAGQILKYQTIKELVYIEPNPWLVHFGHKYVKMPIDSRFKILYGDGRNFLISDSIKYDCIIVAMSEPTTLLLNRYYTKEFIRILKIHSAKNAVVSFSLNSSDNYLNFENRTIHSVFYNTLKFYFANILILPGEKDYFIASDGNLSSNIGHLYGERKIINIYVNPGFIDDRSLSERSLVLLHSLIPDAPVNTDLKPVATSIQTALFFSQFKINHIFLMVIIIFILLIPVSKLNSISFCMYTTGFTASSLEMLTLFVFQIIFGYLYAAAGIIFAIFMAGLAVGSWIGLPAGKEMDRIKILQWIMVLLAFLVPFFLTLLVKINLNTITYPALFVLIFTPALITGLQFSLMLGALGNGQPGFTGHLYGADLLGSALGFLVVSTLLVPLLGIFSTGIVLAVISFLGIAILKLSKQR
jgi:spermidine synthase